jgi:hypothetical protein
VFATNERLTSATNRVCGGERRSEPVAVGRGVAEVVPAPQGSAERGSGGVVAGVRTANRRSRESYNAYQREYMRKRRAERN